MKRTITLFTLWQTPVKVNAISLGELAVVWGILCGLEWYWHPERWWPTSVWLGTLSAIVLIFADVGHALAHILSARRAGAPMDEIRILGDMPRTIYFNNNVPPAVHRMRALGGPIYSAVGLGLSLLLVAGTAPDSFVHEIAFWSSLGQGFILAGSLFPLPPVDGGTILKWTLVKNSHRTPEQADVIVRQVDLTIGIVAVLMGIVCLALQWWWAGLIALGVGGIAIATVLGKIR
jgi:hypothetical protein